MGEAFDPTSNRFRFIFFSTDVYACLFNFLAFCNFLNCRAFVLPPNLVSDFAAFIERLVSFGQFAGRLLLICPKDVGRIILHAGDGALPFISRKKDELIPFCLRGVGIDLTK